MGHQACGALVGYGEPAQCDDHDVEQEGHYAVDVASVEEESARYLLIGLDTGKVGAEVVNLLYGGDDSHQARHGAYPDVGYGDGHEVGALRGLEVDIVDVHVLAHDILEDASVDEVGHHEEAYGVAEEFDSLADEHARERLAAFACGEDHGEGGGLGEGESESRHTEADEEGHDCAGLRGGEAAKRAAGEEA